MAVGQERLFSAYGWPGGYESVPLPTLAINRAPTTMDYGVPGQQWLNTSVTPGVMYYMANNAAGSYNWIILETSGGTGTFSSLTVTPGPTNITGTTNINTSGAGVTSIGTGGTGAVNIGNTTGNTAVTGTLTSSGNITASSGGITATAGNITATNGNLILSTAGNKLEIATGTNASVGTTSAMVAGTTTVATTAVTASSRILVSPDTPGGTQGHLSIGTIVAGTSFVINSSSSTDTSTVNWLIIN